MNTALLGSVIFVLVTALVTFFILKKAVKMAIRAAIIAVILLVAVVGGASLWWFGAGAGATPVTIKKSR